MFYGSNYIYKKGLLSLYYSPRSGSPLGNPSQAKLGSVSLQSPGTSLLPTAPPLLVLVCCRDAKRLLQTQPTAIGRPFCIISGCKTQSMREDDTGVLDSFCVCATWPRVG